MSRQLYGSQSARIKDQFQKPLNYVQRVLDSDEEVDDIGAEDKILFQKVPESIVKSNINTLSNKKPNQDDLIAMNQSPMKEINTNGSTKYHTKSLNAQDSELLKKMIYNMSPREAANEYIRKSQQKSTPQNQNIALRSFASPTKPKNFPYTFNSPTRYNQENYEENKQKQIFNRDQDPEYTSYSEKANKIYNAKFYSENKARKTDIGAPENKNLLLVENMQRRESTSKEAQDALTSRLAKEGEVRNEHNKALAESYLSKELRECTFTPKTLNDRPRRNFDEFLEDQKNFVTQTEMKKKKLQEQAVIAKAQEEGSYKPEINQNSARIVKKKNEASSVHNRLFNTSKGLQKKLLEDSPVKGYSLMSKGQGESSDFIGPISVDKNRVSSVERQNLADDFNFKPNIQARSKSIKRKDKVEDVLYNDALRRKNKMTEAAMAQKSAQVKTISSKSKKALAKRFIKEFDMAILNYMKEAKSPRLNYIQLNEFLRTLKFMRESEQIESPKFTPERQLLQDMWNIMCGEKYQGIHRRNLLVFLLGILDLYFPITKIRPNQDLSKYNDIDSINLSSNQPQSPDQSLVKDRKMIGSFDANENYYLTEEEVGKLHKMFELFYLNRLSAADNIGQLIKNRNFEDHPYHPEINKFSKNLAQTYRDKMLEGAAELVEQNKFSLPKDGVLTHADLLIASKKVAEEKIKRQEQVVREGEARNCTFKPQTNFYDSNPNSAEYETINYQSKGNISMVPTSPRTEELYSLAKPRVLKRDKDASEVEYEKNQEEYTFKPNMYAKKDLKSNEAEKRVVKGAEKTIERLRKAQNEKDQQKVRMQSGFTTGEEKNFVFTMRKNKSEKEYKKAEIDSDRYSSAKTKAEEDHRIIGDDSDQLNVKASEVDTNDIIQSSKEGLPREEKAVIERKIKSPKEDEAFQRHLEEYDDNQKRVPLLFVDVNISQGKTDRIVVFEGDTAEELAKSFSEQHGLHPSMKDKLKALLDTQLAGLLTRIDEEANSMHSETERSSYNESS